MKFKYEDFLLSGKVVENKVLSLLTKFEPSSKQEDLNGVDLKISLTFDVKSAKKIRRSDLSPSYTKTWIEYKNVNGDLGSICKPNLDFFLIEDIDFWHVKSREDTYNFFIQQCKDGDKYKNLIKLEYNTEVSLYQPYQRKNRKDVIMLVEIHHPEWPTLMKLPKSNY